MKLLLAVLLLAAPASAEDKLRDLCAERPGLDTPACTIDPGHLQLEFGAGDWTLDRQAQNRTDTITVSQISARYGVGDRTEIRLGWDGYSHIRVRDRSTNMIDHVSGAADISVGLKQNVSSPSGDGFSAALLAYATLPVGKKGIGAGDWGTGLLIPVSYDLTERLTLEATPEIDAAVNGGGHGRHMAYGSAAGIGIKLDDKWSMSIESQLIRDRDPEQHSTRALGGVYVAWQSKERLQFDAGAQAGLNQTTADVEIYFGVTEKF